MYTLRIKVIAEVILQHTLNVMDKEKLKIVCFDWQWWWKKSVMPLQTHPTIILCCLLTHGFCNRSSTLRLWSQSIVMFLIQAFDHDISYFKLLICSQCFCFFFTPKDYFSNYKFLILYVISQCCEP